MTMEEQNCFKCCLRTVALQQAEQQRAALRLSADASTDMQPGVNFVFLLLGYHKVSWVIVITVAVVLQLLLVMYQEQLLKTLFLFFAGAE